MVLRFARRARGLRGRHGLFPATEAGRGVLDRFVDRLDVRVWTGADRRGPSDLGKTSCWNRGDFIFPHVIVRVALAGLKSGRGGLAAHQETLIPESIFHNFLIRIVFHFAVRHHRDALIFLKRTFHNDVNTTFPLHYKWERFSKRAKGLKRMCPKPSPPDRVLFINTCFSGGGPASLKAGKSQIIFRR